VLGCRLSKLYIYGSCIVSSFRLRVYLISIELHPTASLYLAMNPPRKRQRVSFACQRCRQRKLGVRWLSALNVSGVQANPSSVTNSVLASYVCEPVQRVYHVEV
jgi:hypothetical protein